MGLRKRLRRHEFFGLRRGRILCRDAGQEDDRVFVEESQQRIGVCMIYSNVNTSSRRSVEMKWKQTYQDFISSRTRAQQSQVISIVHRSSSSQ